MEPENDLDRFTADMAYLDQHREEFLRQYPERWVAVYNLELVGAAKHLKRLLKQLERRGIHLGDAYIQYLSEDEPDLILPCA